MQISLAAQNRPTKQESERYNGTMGINKALRILNIRPTILWRKPDSCFVAEKKCLYKDQKKKKKNTASTRDMHNIKTGG